MSKLKEVQTKGVEFKVVPEEELPKQKDKSGKAKTLSQLNSAMYKKPTSEKKVEKDYFTPGGMKQKVVLQKQYGNGVVKNTLIDVKKDGISLSERHKQMNDKINRSWSGA